MTTKSRFFLIVAIVLLGGFVFALSVSAPTESDVSVVDTGLSEVINIESPALTESTCNNAGGEWNECGSACRAQEDEVIVCVEVCVEYCECHGDDQCPSGHSCQEYVEEVGICKPF